MSMISEDITSGHGIRRIRTDPHPSDLLGSGCVRYIVSLR